MRALIAGGAGFVGSHLGEALLKRGAEVETIDDLSTGSINNIEHLKGLKHFCYGIDTLLNRPYLAELIDRADVIFHLAAAVGVRLIVESSVRTIETNVRGKEGFEDMRRRVPDLTKIRRVIGYEPTIGLAEILRLVSAYYRGQ
jgi:nucleoside-diphosphate-sugar epimerase